MAKTKKQDLKTDTCETKKQIQTLDANAAAAKSLQSRPTPCNPIDGSPPGSAVPGILQARTLEWGAIAFSKTLMTEIQITKPLCN